MNDLQIFDKNGNPIQIEDIIYRFIKYRADKYKKNIEDVFIGVDVGFSKKSDKWIYTVEAVDNGYDGIDLRDFGDEIKIN